MESNMTSMYHSCILATLNLFPIVLALKGSGSIPADAGTAVPHRNKMQTANNVIINNFFMIQLPHELMNMLCVDYLNNLSVK
jgi:hypothetical protein